MTIDSPSGQAPAALRWEFSVPPVIAISTADITIGEAAELARKTLTCVAKPAILRRIRFACLLAGGQDPISNGPVAIVKYRAQWDVKSAPISVVIESICGVSVSLKRIPIATGDGSIVIR